jgi:hypothetical protein
MTERNTIMSHTHQPITRRTFVASTLAMAVSIPFLTREVAAQAGTPAATGLGQLGLPELRVTITTEGYEGIPLSLPAGRYLVTATGEPETAVGFLQPTGMSMDDVLIILQGGQASPASGTPASGGDDSGPPPAGIYDFLFAGGVWVIPGQANQAVLDLPPGDWVAWGQDTEASQKPLVFKVTGEMPASPPEPKVNATVTFDDFAIDLTDGQLSAGNNIIRIDNAGDQPHFLELQKGPDGLTRDDLKAALEAEMTGTPAASGIDPDKDFMPVFGTASQSRNITMWQSVDLEPGTYAALCFFPDKASGEPHAFMGMYNVFQVKDTRVMRVTDEAIGWSYA